MDKRNFTYDPDELTMVFTADRKNHIRVAFNEGQVWYAITDIAKILRYRAPGKVANDYQEYGVKLLRVPHTSENVRGHTNCNCVTKDALKRFLKIQTQDRDICDWILDTVIPQAEKQFSEAQPPWENNTPEPVKDVLTKPPERSAVIGQVASLLSALDNIIIAAVTLRSELQYK